MAQNEKLDEIREEIDEIDANMIKLFTRRMRLADDIAEVKREGNISLINYEREEKVVQNAIDAAYPGLEGEAVTFVRSVMALSKSRQREKLYGSADEYFFPAPREPLKENVTVAYEGMPGSWGEVAARNFYCGSGMLPAATYEDVFAAVKDGRASYGVVPIENALTGGVGEVHDLLRKYGCYIVGQTWVEKVYCLMGQAGTRLEDIKQVYSHPRVFGQCEEFLKGRSWELATSRTVARGAEKAALAADPHVAAIAPPRAAEVSGLTVLHPGINTYGCEKTRYILISGTPEYNENCDTVSVIFRVLHRSGALVDTLFPLMSENVNMKRLESRPVADGKYCFFCDMEGNIRDDSVRRALQSAAASCGYLEVLGCFPSETQTRYVN